MNLPTTSESDHGFQPQQLDTRGLSIFSLAVSCDGEHLLTGSDDRTVRLWEAASGEEIGRFMFPRRVLPRCVSVVGFLAGDARVFAAESGGAIVVLDSGLNERVCSIACPCWAPFFAIVPTTHVVATADATRVIVGWPDGTLRTYDAQTGTEHQRVRASKRGITSLAASPQKHLCATAVRGGLIQLWDFEDLEQKLEIDLGASDSRLLVRCLCFSPFGSALLAGATDGYATLLDLAACRVLNRFGGDWGEVSSAAFSASGDCLALGTFGGFVRVWDIHRDRERLVLDCRHGRSLNAGRIPVAFADEGRVLLTGDADGVIRYHPLDR